MARKQRKGAHSTGIAGSFRASRQNVSRIKAADGSIHEYQVGPANVSLDCPSNFKGGAGASFVGIRKAAKKVRTPKCQVAVLISRDSQSKNCFRWVQGNTRVLGGPTGLLALIDYADASGYNTAEFAEMLLALDYPVTKALTWRFIQVYE